MTELATTTQWPYGSLIDGLFSPSFSKDLFEGLDVSFEKAFNIKSAYPYDIIIERDKNKQVTAYNLNYALSGFHKDDISVKVVGDKLKIEAFLHREESSDTPTIEYAHNGIAHRDMKVCFKIGSMVDKKNITMKFEDGLLQIRIPFAMEEAYDVKFN